MSGAARYTALLDACALYPALMRDMLLTLAHADLYNARWSRHIEAEILRNLRGSFPGREDGFAGLLARMRDAVPDCLVTGYESLIDMVTLPDADDRHVLAAAIAGHADAIVTSNVRHFPLEVLGRHNIEVQTPDEFIVNQLDLRKLPALIAIKNMRARWARPEVSADGLLKLLASRQMPLTAALLAEAIELI